VHKKADSKASRSKMLQNENEKQAIFYCFPLHNAMATSTCTNKN
jgi:hypothetical protein